MIFFAGSASSVTIGDTAKAIVVWTKESFGYRTGETTYPTEDEIRQQELFQDLAAVLETYEITAPVVPTWMPKGFELESFKVDHWLTWRTLYSLYRYGERVLTIQYVITTDPLVKYEADRDEDTIFFAGGIEHRIKTNSGTIAVTWTSDNIECVIDGDISLDEMKKLINSIYER